RVKRRQIAWEARAGRIPVRVPEERQLVLAEQPAVTNFGRRPVDLGQQLARELVLHPIGIGLPRRITRDDERDALLYRELQRITFEERRAYVTHRPNGAALLLVLQQIAIQLAVELGIRLMNNVLDAQHIDRAPDVVPRHVWDVHVGSKREDLEPVVV